MADAGAAGDLPQDAKVIIEILRSMGVENYEPRVVNQLLEFMYRYFTDALSDARTYSEHANKPAIDIDDVKLAIQSRVNFSFTQPPPREVLLELAKQRNSIPLPEIEPRPGLRLPPDVDTLTAPNYQIATPDERPQTTR
ncbi:Transcription initiation factor TFIID subunit [Klebsormidium nitens]|uniref:Transcription initiation factor TFIID subunit n=1 Tax=Klebsormidium nitens TaxID=105231 RepID=A0A1Y1HTJ5_KLENI|nr:Transcription initiation factor TFIID subunit [Klebsormidium nitens]|eukprot:GAQ80499.1 Transcription initiation factor TFIID subunit [Klebsormidium nitens]